MPPTPVRSLILTVIEGQNLAPKDSNGLSDPYCVIRLSSGKGTKKTKVIKKTLNPMWNESFVLSPLKEDSKLKITCWDEDLLIDDFEGQVLVDLSEFKELGVNQERTFTLQGRGKKKEEISGCLVLNFLICEGSVSAMSTKKKQNIPVFKYESDLSLPPAIAEYQVFGVPLKVLLQREDKEIDEIPSVIQNLITNLRKRGVKEEGIFRKVGCHNAISTLKHEIDRGTPIDFSVSKVHDLSSLLKKFLGDLPEPLLTYNLYHILIEPDNADSTELSTIKKSILMIPLENLTLLKEILLLLKDVIRNSSTNQMPLKSLAICVAPTLLWDEQQQIFIDLAKIDKLTGLLMALVLQYDYIFEFHGNEKKKVVFNLRQSGVIDEGTRLFLTYDTNGDGVMDKPEFFVFYKEICETLELPEPKDKDIEAAYHILDPKLEQKISNETFSAWWRGIHSNGEVNL